MPATLPPSGGRSAGMTSDRLTDLLIAISEVLGNSMAHAGDSAHGAVLARRNSLVYEVRDGGHIDDPSRGAYRPRRSRSPVAACSWSTFCVTWCR